MSTIIKQIDASVIEVNGKTVQKDLDGSWVAKFEELTMAELRAFKRHLTAIKYKEDAKKNS